MWGQDYNHLTLEQSLSHTVREVARYRGRDWEENDIFIDHQDVQYKSETGKGKGGEGGAVVRSPGFSQHHYI